MTEKEFFKNMQDAFRYPVQRDRYVPLSVRHGSRLKRFRWAVDTRREALALRLAPWLRRS